MRKVGVTPLIVAATATGAGPQLEVWHTNRTFEAFGNTASGTGSAVVAIEVRNDENAAWKTLATITLSLTAGGVSDGLATSAAWRFIRANTTTLSGTGATVSVNVGSAPL